MITVTTKHAVYTVDRENTRWKRMSVDSPHDQDGEWVEGGFTLNVIGAPGFAHFASHPDGAVGRQTSRIISITEES